MAVRVTSISSTSGLEVEHKGNRYTLRIERDGATHVPFAYATALSRQLRPLPDAPRIPFLRVLRPNQIAPTMVMKMRISMEGFALNAQGCADGKTTQAYWLVSQLNPLRTLFVSPRVNIAEQIVKEGIECTGIMPYRADDPSSVPEGARIVVVMVHVMHQLPTWFLRSVDLLIVDECDRVAGPIHGTNLLHCTPKRILGMTATPGELNSQHVDPVVGLLYGLKPILPGVRKPFKVIRILYPYTPPVCNHWYVDRKTGQRKFGADWGKILEHISGNHRRNVDMVRLIRMLLAKAENKVFILVKYKYHVRTLQLILEHVGMVKNRDFALVYGDEDDKNVVCCRLYVGTYSKGEAGFDEKGLRGFDGRRVNHVILGIDVTDPRQGIGRGFRFEGVPCVWEVLDDHDIIRGYHAAPKEKWYLENGALSIRTVELDDIELGDDVEMEEPPKVVSLGGGYGRGGGYSGGGGRGTYGRGRGGYTGRGRGKSTYNEPP
jgi:hypothetical protein